MLGTGRALFDPVLHFSNNFVFVTGSWDGVSILVVQLYSDFGLLGSGNHVSRVPIHAIVLVGGGLRFGSAWGSEDDLEGLLSIQETADDLVGPNFAGEDCHFEEFFGGVIDNRVGVEGVRNNGPLDRNSLLDLRGYVSIVDLIELVIHGLYSETERIIRFSTSPISHHHFSLS